MLRHRSSLSFSSSSQSTVAFSFSHRKVIEKLKSDSNDVKQGEPRPTMPTHQPRPTMPTQQPDPPAPTQQPDPPAPTHHADPPFRPSSILNSEHIELGFSLREPWLQKQAKLHLSACVT
ncbi:hypothetical protein EXN66_Car010207 [Channa argus]|uniref:Uncharacterized protein n=1 Tax=Channa argus TaxID=215402 RepID=A0A6G1PW14_CHAAH|nr:hypothetical protein EXN66_Car010207 [Channa argus]